MEAQESPRVAATMAWEALQALSCPLAHHLQQEQVLCTSNADQAGWTHVAHLTFLRRQKRACLVYPGPHATSSPVRMHV